MRLLLAPLLLLLLLLVPLLLRLGLTPLLRRLGLLLLTPLLLLVLGLLLLAPLLLLALLRPRLLLLRLVRLPRDVLTRLMLDGLRSSRVGRLSALLRLGVGVVLTLGLMGLHLRMSSARGSCPALGTTAGSVLGPKSKDHGRMTTEPQLGMPKLGTHLPNKREPDPSLCDAPTALADHYTSHPVVAMKFTPPSSESKPPLVPVGSGT